ncbi:Dat1p SCDLUD_001271 [Saccharomycodes ludwigii]|uniref:Dat1p n=1 Tax=Saccharomycodes ludwigii TaxID=36035 RepID=UPI001E85D127|nr:hypothetical protein SCDLUD_001271 [Saccharomycodes ludwigii]KAH3903626.1 hypothetical protein SCDLUD_001271 [Saccharomycodes ludwigii]
MAKKLSEGRKKGSGRKPGSKSKTLTQGRKKGSGRKYNTNATQNNPSIPKTQHTQADKDAAQALCSLFLRHKLSPIHVPNGGFNNIINSQHEYILPPLSPSEACNTNTNNNITVLNNTCFNNGNDYQNNNKNGNNKIALPSITGLTHYLDDDVQKQRNNVDVDSKNVHYDNNRYNISNTYNYMKFRPSHNSSGTKVSIRVLVNRTHNDNNNTNNTAAGSVNSSTTTTNNSTNNNNNAHISAHNTAG